MPRRPIAAEPVYRGRFAPSPTGPLHLGSLVAALASWLFARRAGGSWLVRIEDIDPPREVPGASLDQLRTLEAFGFEPDEPVLWQGRRCDAYRAALDTLAAGGRAFPCRCSRRELEGSGGVHRRCRPGAGDVRPAWRFRVPDGTTVSITDRIQGRYRQRVDHEVGDFVLRRRDGLYAYQLAVVVDDAFQGITEVVRGADLLDSTPRQVLLQRALGLATPAYAHVPLVLDGAGRKLSKSLAALPIDRTDPLPALRAAWAGLGQDPVPLARLRSPRRALDAALAAFDPARIGRQPRRITT